MVEDRKRISRQNGRKSRGPRGPRNRTERFIPKPSYPALLISEGALASYETQEKLRECHQHFREAWRPVGFNEEILVEKLTSRDSSENSEEDSADGVAHAGASGPRTPMTTSRSIGLGAGRSVSISSSKSAGSRGAST